MRLGLVAVLLVGCGGAPPATFVDVIVEDGGGQASGVSQRDPKPENVVDDAGSGPAEASADLEDSGDSAPGKSEAAANDVDVDAAPPVPGPACAMWYGHYAGNFTCAYPARTGPTIDDGGPLEIVGTVTLDVKGASASGNFTATGAGGADVGGSTVAPVSGAIDCNSGVFTGSLSGGPITILGGLFEGTWAGKPQGTFTGAAFVNGQMELQLTLDGQGDCYGAWSAQP